MYVCMFACMHACMHVCMHARMYIKWMQIARRWTNASKSSWACPWCLQEYPIPSTPNIKNAGISSFPISLCWLLVFCSVSCPLLLLLLLLCLLTSYSHATYLHITLSHTTYSHTTNSHTTFLHTTCPHRTFSHATYDLFKLAHTHTERVHTQLTNTNLPTHLLRTTIANSDVECILRARTLQVYLTGMGRWQDPRSIKKLPSP